MKFRCSIIVDAKSSAAVSAFIQNVEFPFHGTLATVGVQKKGEIAELVVTCAQKK